MGIKEELTKKIFQILVGILITIIFIIILVYTLYSLGFSSISIVSFQNVTQNGKQILGSGKPFSAESIEKYQPFLRYGFGISENVGLSGLIIIVSIWLIFFGMFSDMISSFGLFRKSISWIIGFCFTIILASTGQIYNFAVYLIGIFGPMGSNGIILGLVLLIVVMSGINFGIKLGKQKIEERKEKEKLAKEIIRKTKEEAGKRILESLGEISTENKK